MCLIMPSQASVIRWKERVRSKKERKGKVAKGRKKKRKHTLEYFIPSLTNGYLKKSNLQEKNE